MGFYSQYKDSKYSVGLQLHHMEQMGLPITIVEEVQFGGRDVISYYGRTFAWNVHWTNDGLLPIIHFVEPSYVRQQWAHLEAEGKLDGALDSLRYLFTAMPLVQRRRQEGAVFDNIFRAYWDLSYDTPATELLPYARLLILSLGPHYSFSNAAISHARMLVRTADSAN